jgi:glutamyl-tRNA synthetase
MNWDKKIRAYALKNAVAHEGKSQEGAVISSLFHEGLKKEDVKTVVSDIKKIVFEINKLSLEEQNKEFEKLEKEVSERPEREGLPELPNVNGKVTMRFAPSASGMTHIGHAITGMPSSLYVKRYGGIFYLRIEDTNPENIEPKSYRVLVEDCSWLFGNVSEVIIQSDRLEVYYKYAQQFIDRESAYVCTCSSEEFKKLVEKRKPCPCRNNSVQDNLQRWAKMLDKKGYKEGDAVLRFKSDFGLNNPALIDFPLARINLKKHPRVGTKYRVWPLMNLAVFADDVEYNMTHIIRAKEHMDNAKRQELMYTALGLEKITPVTVFLGRYKFTDMEISKTKIGQRIRDGEFTGWDDVRLPLIATLRKRGYTRETFEQFAIQRGISEVDKVLTKKDFFDVLDNINREIIKDVAIGANFKMTEKGKFRVIMPDAKIKRFNSEIKPKVGGLYHFVGFGYAKFDGKKFYFTHE